MAAYFQSVMQEEAIIKEAIQAFEAEAMKALETTSYVFLDGVFNAAGINLPSGMTKDAFLDKLEESLHYTLKVNWNTYEHCASWGDSTPRPATASNDCFSRCATTWWTEAAILFEETNEMSGSEHGDASSDDADVNSSENGFDSGESDQSSDGELEGEMHLVEEDIPEDFLGIYNAAKKSMTIFIHLKMTQLITTLVVLAPISLAMKPTAI
ncbi:hypothetical protein AC1031_014317 [Aphanomyces cochlioides]|nr:hypothetical protein AC1031_014317 [Aphanomyces cochlioides]